MAIDCVAPDLPPIPGGLLTDGGIPPPPDIIPDCLNAPLPLLDESNCLPFTAGNAVVVFASEGSGSDIGLSRAFDGDCCDRALDMQLSIPCAPLAAGMASVVRIPAGPSTLSAAISGADDCGLDVELVFEEACRSIEWGGSADATQGESEGLAVFGSERGEECDWSLDWDLEFPCAAITPASSSAALVWGGSPIGSIGSSFGGTPATALTVGAVLPCVVLDLSADASISEAAHMWRPDASVTPTAATCSQAASFELRLPHFHDREFLKVIGFADEDGLWPAVIQRYSPALQAWYNVSVCKLVDANGLPLELNKRYMAIRQDATTLEVRGEDDDCVFSTMSFKPTCRKCPTVSESLVSGSSDSLPGGGPSFPPDDGYPCPNICGKGLLCPGSTPTLAMQIQGYWQLTAASFSIGASWFDECCSGLDVYSCLSPCEPGCDQDQFGGNAVNLDCDCGALSVSLTDAEPVVSTNTFPVAADPENPMTSVGDQNLIYDASICGGLACGCPDPIGVPPYDGGGVSIVAGRQLSTILAVGDPEHPCWGSAGPISGSTPTIYLANFCYRSGAVVLDCDYATGRPVASMRAETSLTTNGTVATGPDGDDCQCVATRVDGGCLQPAAYPCGTLTAGQTITLDYTGTDWTASFTFQYIPPI